VDCVGSLMWSVLGMWCGVCWNCDVECVGNVMWSIVNVMWSVLGM